MKPGDFEKELTALDHEFERAGFPAAADARLRARLDAPRPARIRPLVFAAAFVVPVLLTLGAIALWPRGSLGGFTRRDASADFQTTVDAEQRVAVTSGTVTLLDETEGATLQVERGSTLKRMKSGAEVFGGTVRFEVEHRTKEPSLAGGAAGLKPYTVRVSGGLIEVVGTRFTVKENGSTGEVHLEQGVIRFRATDGTVTTLAPGDSVSWPPPPAPEPEPQPTEPSPEPAQKLSAPRPSLPTAPLQPAPAPAPEFSVEAVLSQVASLRSRGQYEEAVTLLTASMKERMGAATRERLSFELGSILSHQLHDVTRGCAQWAKHAKDYPSGRYQQAVQAEQAGLKCAPQ